MTKGRTPDPNSVRFKVRRQSHTVFATVRLRAPNGVAMFRLVLAPLAAALFWGAALAQTTSATDAAGSGGPICADRPTKSSNACALDTGRWQIEADGLNFTRLKDGGVTTDTWLIANPTVKYGFATNLDVEANLPLYEDIRVKGAAGSVSLAGIGDLYLRLKWQAYTSKDGNTQVGLYPFVKLPTARRGLGNRQTEAGVIVPVNIKLNDQWSIGFAPEADALLDADGSGRHLNTVQTFNVGYTLPHDWTVYAEIWGDWNLDPAGTVRQYSLDFAVARLIGKDLQFDGGVNLGLNRATPDVNLYVGVSRRF